MYRKFTWMKKAFSHLQKKVYIVPGHEKKKKNMEK